MRIITLNCNGIRSAARKGFFPWMTRQRADVICLQETKAQVHQLEDRVFWPRGYHAYFHDAEKKGYSGVAIYSRHKPDKVIEGLGWPDVDAEGRYIEARFGGQRTAPRNLPRDMGRDVILAISRFLGPFGSRPTVSMATGGGQDGARIHHITHPYR